MQRKLAEARAEYGRALEVRLAAFGPDHPHVAMTRSNLGNILALEERYDEAIVEQSAALEVLIEVLGSDHPSIGQLKNNLGVILAAAGRLEAAEVAQRSGLEIWEKALGSQHPEVAVSRVNLARLLLDLGRASEALELAEEAWIWHSGEDVPAAARGESAYVLARALRASHSVSAADRTRAAELGELALTEFVRAGDAHPHRVAEIRKWLHAAGHDTRGADR
jgi:eukaryotic-like serine/threonine-protein kinase